MVTYSARCMVRSECETRFLKYMANKKLRIGVLLDSFDIPLWAYSMLESIQQSGYAEVSLVVMNSAPHVQSKYFELRNLFTKRRKLFYLSYLALERKLFRNNPDAFATKNAASLLAAAQQVNVTPRKTVYSDYIEGEKLDIIRQHGADVLIRLGFRILRGGILQASRLGVWSYHHGDISAYRGHPPGFWEMMERQPVMGCVLQILTEDLDNGPVLYRSFSSINPLLSRTLNSCYWKAATFIPRKLKELYELGEEEFRRKVNDSVKHPFIYSRKLYSTPRNIDVIIFVFRQLRKFYERVLLRWLFLEQWILLYRWNNGFPSSFRHFKKLVPPNDRFWADPFVVQKGNTYYIFFEEFEFSNNRGHISAVTIDQEGAVSELGTVLERPYHLSYPFIFEWGGEYYMLPETVQNRTVELYKCVEFPHKWKLQKTLITNISAVDATLFQQEDRWWIFTNVRDAPGMSTMDELFLFYADSPISGHWQAHPRNPVVSDVRRARPAGKLFHHMGGIYRPSQDCSVRYGYGLRISEVAKLNETTYEEREAIFAKPEWDDSVRSVHTFNSENQLSVADAVCYQRKKSWYLLFLLICTALLALIVIPAIHAFWYRVIHRITFIILVLLIISLLKYKPSHD